MRNVMLMLLFLIILPFGRLYAADLQREVYLYEVGNNLLLVIPRPQSLIIELREFFGAELIDRAEIYSPYEAPKHYLKNVVASDVPELIVESRSGGTGLSVKNISVFVVSNNKIENAGEFILEESVNHPTLDYESSLQGTVEFLDSGRLLYKWERDGHDAKKDLSAAGNDLYEYKDKYIKINDQQTHPVGNLKINKHNK